jgi:hypothetical protein
MTNHPNRSQTEKPYRVTGDHKRMVYSRHDSPEAAIRAAHALAAKWGWSHPGSEPIAECLTESGWMAIGG